MILFLSAPSPYGVGEALIKAYAEHFSGLVINALYLQEELSSLPNHPITAIATLNGWQIEVGGEPLNKALGVPLLSIGIDDPFSPDLLNRYLCADPTTIYTICDPTLAHLLSKYLQVDIHYLPHLPLKPTQEFAGERDIPYLFAGTYKIPGDPPYDLAFLEQVVRTKHKPLLAQWEGDLLNPKLLYQIELWVRYERRRRMLNRYAQEGKCVTLLGKGWDDLDCIDVHCNLGERPIREVLTFMQRAQVVLHSSPAFTADSHERVLSALFAGAKVES